MEFYQNKKGFTLVEILVVIAIISILLGIFFYFWNTADIFRKSRDSKRINDLNLIDSALKTLLITESNVNLGEEDIIYISLPDNNLNCSSYNLPQVFSPYSYRCQTTNNYLKIDGSGWIPLNFSLGKILNLTVLPVDPLNNKDYFYSYQVKKGKYKLTAKFENSSNVFRMVNDNGFEPSLYEVGSNLYIPSPQGGLVGYWSFDEGTGTIAYDLSGNNNHGTLYNGPQWTTGKVGGALSFDGVNDYVWLGSPDSLRIFNFTIEAWFKTSASPTYQDIYRWRTYGIDFGIPTFEGTRDHLEIMYYDSTGVIYRVSSPSIVNDGLWHHGAGTFDGSNLKLYLDGKEIGSLSTTVSVHYGSGGAAIGRAGNFSGGYFNGLIDEVRIYNRALSPEEIKAIYEATK